MHTKSFYTQQHCYVSLKTLYPGGIWTRVFLFLRWMRCPLRQAARATFWVIGYFVLFCWSFRRRLHNFSGLLFPRLMFCSNSWAWATFCAIISRTHLAALLKTSNKNCFFNPKKIDATFPSKNLRSGFKWKQEATDWLLHLILTLTIASYDPRLD
jgi:hypothetical protein